MDLTFVFPCLNEERSLGDCISRVRKSLDADPNLKYEIVVADNGSTDRSREIATELGARVVPVPKRGYGAALKHGIDAAEGRYAMFADSDGTYLYEHSLPLYRATNEINADMGIASRIKGKISPGAMPFLHHYLGTPVLTFLINLFFQWEALGLQFRLSLHPQRILSALGCAIHRHGIRLRTPDQGAEAQGQMCGNSLWAESLASRSCSSFENMA